MRITRNQKEALWQGVYGNQDWKWVFRPVTAFSSTFVIRREPFGPEFMWVDFVDLEDDTVEAVLTPNPIFEGDGREGWSKVYEFDGPLLTVKGMERMFQMFLGAIESEYQYSDAYFPPKRLLFPYCSNNELASPETHTDNFDAW